MCSLQLATQTEQENLSETKINEEVNKRLEKINQSIQDVINS
jgi:hypothetical protein